MSDAKSVPVLNTETMKYIVLGRGKRVSEWPGNVFFRHVVKGFRKRYAAAHRTNKTEVARLAIKEVHRAGAKFMYQESEGVWKELSMARAVEKSCQALRERVSGAPDIVTKDKDYRDFPWQIAIKAAEAGSPIKAFLSTKPRGDVATLGKPAPASTKKRPEPRMIYPKPVTGKKKLQTLGYHPNPKATTGKKRSLVLGGTSKPATAETRPSMPGGRSAKNPRTAFSLNRGSSLGSGSGSKPHFLPGPDNASEDEMDISSTTRFDDSPANRAANADAEEMLRRLASFKRRYGHCAVPPAFPSDRLLGDWCTAQRLYCRVAKADSDEGTAILDERQKFQETLMKRLHEMGFVWDYDEWHWNYRFKRFVSSYKKAEAKEAKAVDPVSIEWLHDQRHQQMELRFNLLSSRLRNLQEVGISLT